MPTERLLDEGPVQTLRIHRTFVTGVVEAPYGAHFTSCVPDYGRDEELQQEYAAAAADPALWREFASRWVEVDEDGIPRAVEARLKQAAFA